MNSLIGHIFGSLDNHDKALNHIYNNLKTQKTFNKYVVCFMIVGCAYVHINNKVVARLERNNRRLAKLMEEHDEESLEQVKDILKKALGEE